MKLRTKRWICKNPGLVADAKELGVHYTHLWKVLEGKRESRSLLRRYHELKRQQRETADA